MVKGGGGEGTSLYTLTPHNDGTTFECESVYTMPNPPIALLDRLAPPGRSGVEGGAAAIETSEKRGTQHENRWPRGGKR
jgi:hypothetical protein